MEKKPIVHSDIRQCRFSYSRQYSLCNTQISSVSRCTTGAAPVTPLTISPLAATRDRCEIFLDIFYMPWPEALSCDRLPDSPEPGVCVGYSQAREPPDLGGTSCHAHCADTRQSSLHVLTSLLHVTAEQKRTKLTTHIWQFLFLDPIAHFS